MDEFKSQIPDLAQSLREHIAEAHQKNKRFRDAFALFVALRRVSLSPELSQDKVDDMLIQHLLTERLMRNLFQNREFTTRNVIAAQVQNVIKRSLRAASRRPSF
jgi:predicted helicase